MLKNLGRVADLRAARAGAVFCAPLAPVLVSAGCPKLGLPYRSRATLRALVNSPRRPYLQFMAIMTPRGPADPFIPDGNYGPKFRALNSDRHRAFILALLQQGDRNAAAAYRAAGYQTADEYVKQEAYRLLHDQRIQEALHEQASRSLHALVPMALRVLGDIVENPQEKGGDRIKGAVGILDRAGLHATTESKTTVELSTDTETLALIRQLAIKNGIPLASLLGGRLAETIETEYEDVTPRLEDFI